MHLWKSLRWSEEISVPGLIGYTNGLQKYNDVMLLGMRKQLKYFDWYIDDRVYSDEVLRASRTHLGIIKQGQQPYNPDNRFYSWLEGEFYNQDELKVKHDVVAGNDNELLLNIYRKTKSFDFLRNIDGYYAAVVYDKVQGIIYLITDRYGFKPLYWGLVNGSFVWSSELKGFLAHTDFKIRISPAAVAEFFEIGYLLENKTWFDGVELMPPSAVLTFKIGDCKVDISHYWTWCEIKPFKKNLRENDLIEELGDLFVKAVQTRIKREDKIGLTLSGGLDSRAILAAIPEGFSPVHAFTFGQEGCDDISIAARVSAIKEVTHHVLYLEPANWLYPRIAGVWKTDGLLNIMHMHGIEFCNHYKSNVDIILNGFAGDLVFGGSYLKQRNYLDKRINSDIAKDIMHANLSLAPFDDWYLIDKIDPYFLNNRVRRFTNMGLIYLEKLLETRLPFFSNNLIKTIYSLPDALRYKSLIYNKVLLKHFPAYFMDIPYQKTGLPISHSESTVRMLIFKNRIAGRLRREACRLGIKIKDQRHYTDYSAWIRQEPARSFLKKILSDKNALYQVYIDGDNVLIRLKEHLQYNRDHHNELCLALTFEIWLQQVFNGRYRESVY